MTPIVVPAAAAPVPSASARPSAAPLPAQPAPAPLAAPSMVAAVEWAEAVRPPDAMLRALRPDLSKAAPEDGPTGPPPAFSANLLDLLPNSLSPPDHPPDDPAAPMAGATPHAPADTTEMSARQAPWDQGYAAPAAEPQFDRWL